MKRSRILALLLSGMMICLAPAAQGRGHHHRHETGPIAAAELPAQARATLRLIKQGGPFPYSRDGIVFGNREHRLPTHPRGYYHEYTVRTPGVRGRGPRRIVCGPLPECYYSADHYRTFRRIREGQ